MSGTDLHFRKVTFIAVWRVGWKEAILYARMSAGRTLYQNKQQMIKVKQEDDRKLEKFLEMESLRFSDKLDVVDKIKGGFYDEAQISGLGVGYKKYSILD